MTANWPYFHLVLDCFSLMLDLIVNFIISLAIGRVMSMKEEVAIGL